MLNLKYTDGCVPTSPNEISYAAFVAYMDSRFDDFFHLVSGSELRRTNEFYLGYAGLCANIVMLCAGMVEPERMAAHGGNLFVLPEDLMNESALKFVMYGQHGDNALRCMATYLLADNKLNDENLQLCESKLLAFPYHLTASLLAFFLGLSQRMERSLPTDLSTRLHQSSQSFLKSQLNQTLAVQDLARLAVGVDGITLLPLSQVLNFKCNPN